MIDKFKFFLFCILVIQVGWSLVECHTCQHRIPAVSELVTGIKTEPLPPNFRTRRSASPNIRIYFDYQSSFTNSPQATVLQNTIMEPAKAVLQSILIPKSPNTGLLLVDRSCINSMYRINKNVKACAYGCSQTTCLSVPIPDLYLKACATMDSYGTVTNSGTAGAGNSNADIVILVTYTPCGGSTLAYAGSCFSESTLDRPILGVINLCSDKLTANSKIKENIQIVIHEIIHALGFGVDKYAFYRFANGDPIVPRNNMGFPNLGVASGGYYNWNSYIIQSVVRNRASVSSTYTLSFYGFVLPNVLTAARNHFNCPTLAAVDLEDYGSSGSAISHFDEYFLYNELMTPQSNNGINFLSNMTLALLQDTGWYIVNYSTVGNLDYGYKKGCVLPENGCYKYMISQTSTPLILDPFCNIPFTSGRSLGCSLFNEYIYRCNLNRKSSVPQMYQYFTSIPGVVPSDVQYYSGPSPYNEYCPGYMVTVDPSFVCNNELNNNLPNAYNIVPSYFGPDSMCFLNDINNPNPNIIFGASCQKYAINTVTGGITAYVGNSIFNCPSNTQLTFTIADGTVIIFKCPGDRSLSQDIYSSLMITTTTIKKLGNIIKASTYLYVLIIAFEGLDLL